MRTLPAALQAIMDGGVAGGLGIGDKKAISRITIQPDWWLNTSSGAVGNRRFDKLPIRYFQTAANDQTEVEFPHQNLKQVIVDRSLTEDAGTLQVLFYNANTPALGTVGDQPDAFGQPGYYAWARGLSPEAKTRWGQEPNSWSNLLRENALIRLYEGYGDDTLTLAELIDQGYVLLNGMFLVDNVAIEAQTGIGTLNGRDMAKLLIEQETWPPLVPQATYGQNGLIYYVTGQNTVSAQLNYGVGAYTTSRCKFDSASETGPQDGHSPTDCLDGNPDTYYLSESGGSPWIQFDTGEKVSSVYIDPYTTNVTCYVSVMEAGVWVSGPGTINGIPFVTQFGLGAAGWTNLPRWYAANSIRLSFSNLQANANYSGDRAGLREVQLGGSDKVSVADLEALDIAPTPQGEGYRICGTGGAVYNYGDANDFGNKNGFVLNGAIVGIDNSLDGEGYWIVGADGGVFSYGDAHFYGSTGSISLNEPAIGIRRTNTGLGYWIMAADGGVFNFGDATFYGARTDGGDGTGMVDFAVRPQGDGYWQLTASGKIFAYGSAVNYGDLSTLPHPNPIDQGKTAAAMDCTADGTGYWIATTDGSVYGFGTETFYGAITIALNAPISGMRRTASGNGYYLVAADGGVFNFGDATFWGALPGVGQTEGNYQDYSDIVEDMCLYCGFWLKPSTSTPANDKPAVFGNIETTGAWNSVGALDQSVTDKVQCIDLIKTIRDTVGYIFRVDETGAVRFQSPNYWQAGNFTDEGIPVKSWPVLDETVNLTDYVQTTSDQSARSEIIVAAADPYKFGGAPADTTVTRFVPPNIANLHGIVKPAMIGVPLNVPISQQDQELLAEFLALQIFFANRQGQVTAAVHPAICPDDQIKIFERTTGEANTHYVQGVHTEHDLDTGQWLGTYTTYWMGNSNVWSITTSPQSVSQQLGGQGTLTNEQFGASSNLVSFLLNSGAASAQGLPVTSPTEHAD